MPLTNIISPGLNVDHTIESIIAQKVATAVRGILRSIGSPFPRSIGLEVMCRALGGEVNISGGSFPVNFEASNRSLVNITGGTFGDFFEVIGNSIINISGGTFGPHFDAINGTVVNLVGRQFFVNDQPISGLVAQEEFLLTQRDGILSGVLADGSPFSFLLSYIHPPRQVRGFRSGARLTLTLVPEPSTILLLSYCGAIFSVWRRRAA